eukprot:CAMPEP_0117442204 /NCGR_PEP_ID=MMETSP0759-20121206/4030_1 /TAXON_ID=63605 /ORGANISM="Percolomonas cosmopolitus, Strain WS" /LENGTH=341 /DNA_ID=CAMNT_0005234083 /DNA_START=116 /DNA_END=1141 /DNA_ORIENTATION=+
MHTELVNGTLTTNQPKASHDNDENVSPDSPDTLVEFQTHRIHVPGEQKSSHRRFDSELNQYMDPFSLAEERNEGRFVEESGLWRKEKHAVRDDWLDETIEEQEMGKWQQARNLRDDNFKNAESDDDDAVADLLAFKRENEVIEKQALIVILHVMREYAASQEGATNESTNEHTLQDAIQEIHEKANSDMERKDAERKLAVCIAKLSGLPSYATIDIYSQQFAFFDECMNKFRPKNAVQWEYKWAPDQAEIYGPYSSQEMSAWKDAHFFDGHDVVARHVEDTTHGSNALASDANGGDSDDMFGDEEGEEKKESLEREDQENGGTTTLSEFTSAKEIEFEEYR